MNDDYLPIITLFFGVGLGAFTAWAYMKSKLHDKQMELDQFLNDPVPSLIRDAMKKNGNGCVISEPKR
jgi:hypothetical protein